MEIQKILSHSILDSQSLQRSISPGFLEYIHRNVSYFEKLLSKCDPSERVPCVKLTFKAFKELVPNQAVEFLSCILPQACKLQDSELVRYLLKKGASIKPDLVYNRNHPLKIAILKQNPEILQILIDSGADVNDEKEYLKLFPGCKSLFMLALETGNFAVIEILIKSGMNFRLKYKVSWVKNCLLPEVRAFLVAFLTWEERKPFLWAYKSSKVNLKLPKPIIKEIAHFL